MMSVVQLFQHAMQPAADSFVFADAEDLGDLVGGETKQSQLAGALEDLVDRETPPEQEIPAVFDLVQRVLATQGDGGAVLVGELRTQHQGPIIQALADDIRTKTVGGCL